MKSNLKKGFTLVELVIVIAVIAILSAVLIPTFSNLVEKANVSADTQLVRNLNTALATNSDGKNNTMYDAVKAAENGGYVVEKIKPTSKNNEILWDSENNVFCYLNVSENKVEYIPQTVDANKQLSSGSPSLWKIYNEIPTESDFSVYLAGTALTGTVNLNGVGFDCGNNTGITQVNYTNSGIAKDVVIRTNGGSLTINDTNNASHQYHYGTSANVTVATGTSCYECHAIVAALKITQGKAIADEDAYVGVIEANDSVILAEQNGGVFVIPTNVDPAKVPNAVATQIGYTNNGTTITASTEKVEKSYYVITNSEDLFNFAEKWNSGLLPSSINVKFGDNVSIELEDNEAWTPIGNWTYPFNGVFDGNGCIITGIKANATHQNYTHNYATGDTIGEGETYGFFGIVGNGNVIIKDLILKEIDINISNGKDVGGLIGYAPSSSKFANDGNKFILINKDGNAKTGEYSDWWSSSNTAGDHDITISNVVVSGSIYGDYHVGGIVGKIYSTGVVTIENCINNCIIESNHETVGGIAGYIQVYVDSKMENCFNNGSVCRKGYDSPDWSPAGILGRAQFVNACKFSFINCENKGVITSIGDTRHYGILGSSQGVAEGELIFNNCKTVTGEELEHHYNVITTIK